MTCGELWIKVNVNHLLFLKSSLLQTILPGGFWSLWGFKNFFTPLFTSLFSLQLCSHTPHANCFPRLTVTHAHRVNFRPPHQSFSSPYVLFYSPLVSKLICLPLLFLDSSCLSVATVTSLHHSHHRVTPQTHADQRMKIPHSCDEIEQICGRSRSYKSCDGKRALSKAWQNEEEG